jgi:hypothetical protein
MLVVTGDTGPPAQIRARATYSSDVSKLSAFASLSLLVLMSRCVNINIFLRLLSSRSTTALASIFAPP